MSSYTPDNDATAGDPWNTAFLSDRDVSGQVPINFVPHPGVYLTPACFGSGTYEDASFKECFSNLLASEFRRFIVDLYWDTLSRSFRLCPVEIPPKTNATAAAVSMPMYSNNMDKLYETVVMTHANLVARQTTAVNSTSSNVTVQTNATVRTSSTTSIPPVATTTSPSRTVLYQLGPYQCSSTLTFDTIVAILSQYVSQSSDTIQARLQLLVINLHAASTISAPTTPRQPLAQSELPASNELVSGYFGQLDSLIYTPFLLNNERANLNSSWFAKHISDHAPLLNYFTVQRLSSGDLATPDGWPNENYVQLESGWRLVVGYGSIDSSMAGYDLGGDNSTIFTPGYIQSQRSIRISDTGSLTSGCYYDSVENAVSQVNSSWAVSSVMDVDQSIISYAADNVTACGISPVLNFTLDNKPASTGYEAYQSFGNQALFSWASGEPRNASETGLTATGGRWACALMVSNDDYRGHWRVADCTEKRRVACREANLPYLWRLSSNSAQYTGGEQTCSGNTTFDVPRTGLENTYLYQHIRAIATSQGDSSLLDGVWINFNSIDVDSCWVTTGSNGTCPYSENRDAVRQRIILVPTISAFIIILLTALTMLVKCNTNRRKSKVRKRGEGGWDYEGVPS